jgi:hypothetical protein
MDSVKSFFDNWTKNSSFNIEKENLKKRKTIFHFVYTPKKTKYNVPYKHNTQFFLQHLKNNSQKKDIFSQLPFTPAQWYMQYFSPWIKNKQTIHYLKEIWKPIEKITKSNAVGANTVSKILSADKYQTILSSLFTFGLIEDLKHKNQNIDNTWKMPLTLQWLEQGWQSLSFISKQLQTWFFKNNKINIEYSIPFQEDIEIYMQKVTTLQQKFFVLGFYSIEKTAKIILEKENQKNIEFEDFYAIWVNIITKDIQIFLLGDVFNQIWNEVIFIMQKIKDEIGG